MIKRQTSSSTRASGNPGRSSFNGVVCWKQADTRKQLTYIDIVGLQIVLRDQKSKEGFKYQSVEIYWSEQRAGLSLRPESYKEATQKYSITDYL